MRIKIPKCLFFMASILFLLTTQYSLSSPELASTPAENLQSLFEDLEAAHMFNGVVLVAQKGKIIFEKAIGFSDFQKKIPINLNSVFEIGSISKTITSVAVHILAEKGMLSLDDGITKYFPALPYDDITLRGLLSHTSGLFDIWSDPKLRDQFLDFYNRVDVPYTNKDYLAFLKTYQPPVEAAPDKMNIYSNTGYVLLALVVEKVSREPFHEFLEKNIFRPTGMSRTLLLSWPPEHEELKNMVAGYHHDPILGIIPETDPHPGTAVFGMSYGDDEIASTVKDMLAFDQALKNGKILKPETVSRMMVPPRLFDGTVSRYGQGFVVTEEDGVRTVFHGGSTAGFWAHCKFSVEDDDSTVVLFTNVKTALVTFRAISKAVRQILRGKSTVKPKPSVVYPLAEYLEAFKGKAKMQDFVEIVESGQYHWDTDSLISLSDRYRKNGEIQKSRFILECIIQIEPDQETAKRKLTESEGRS